MSLPVNSENIEQLKNLIELCNKDPSIINHPQLSFFKNFIEKLDGKVPKFEKDEKDSSKSFDKSSEPEPQEPESEESDLELDMTGVIEPDNDDPQPMGDYDLQPTEEQIDQSQEKRSEAASAFAEKDYEKAIELYTEAIQLNPQASLLYAKRGQVYLSLNKVNACIRDCNRALELNPDSAAAFKFRGRANQLLGKWEEAANDLRTACKIDFNEQADEWLKEVTPNARKIEEHKRKKERRQSERVEREKQERLNRVREAQAKAREESAGQQNEHAGPPPPPGSAGGPDMSRFAQFLNDNDVLNVFQDPEVAQAFKDISENPTNILKYQSNPKIMQIINKVGSKFCNAYGGGMGGMMGGMGGGTGGETGAGATRTPPNPSSNFDDFNLD